MNRQRSVHKRAIQKQAEVSKNVRKGNIEKQARFIHTMAVEIAEP